ncbi:egt [Euproctis pseudoconspersa nucleopolyhedrovirus]|uniref:Ecdysteroid UDP-glucosyltransferase n=1 Tax=Euproctis pseudoconspersa nucleopolyhedrovirus TaxID=307467 RepID=C3TX38_9ABAC|nr:egt [Euproctis pseudoconspersa nucleopolyhedrovirus]ACO53580.1 egt [Euproctis pseudoconspersa nucleopolyhedrovirus]
MLIIFVLPHIKRDAVPLTSFDFSRATRCNLWNKQFNMDLKILTLVVWAWSLAMRRNVSAARILAVFPTPSYSHQSVFKVYVEALAERGHSIVVIKPKLSQLDRDKHAHDNITVVDATLSERYLEQLFGESPIYRKRGIIADSSTVTARNYMNLAQMISRQLELPNVKKFIAANSVITGGSTISHSTFDVLITEAFMDYSLVLSHLFGNLPVIQISSGHGLAENFETMGAVSRHPIYYPNMWRFKFGDLHLYELINEIYTELRLRSEFDLLAQKQSVLMKTQFGADTPDVNQLRNNVQLLFVNVHPVVDNNRPVPPSVQYLGGLHMHGARIRKLNDYVNEVLDNSTMGLVYVSFGTSVQANNIDNEFMDVLLDCFQRLPYNVVWKFDATTTRRLMPSNVYTQTWFDQYSLLNHKNVKAFVTQGGIQSIDEAIEALVPMVGLPVMGDQAFNVNRYAELGIMRALDTATVNANQLSRTIIDVVTDIKYRNNLRNLRHNIREQIVNPVHKAVWYTEHVIESKKYNSYLLKTKAANVNYSDYLMSQLYVPLITITIMNYLQQAVRTTFFSY